MKYSQTIGFVLCFLLFFVTTQPFVIIDSRHWVLTGWDTAGSNFGQPGKFLVYLGVPSLMMFALPYIWAKRTNIILGALLFAWSLRNYFILSACQMGECPQKQWALYACMIITGGILIMSFLPKMDVSNK